MSKLEPTYILLASLSIVSLVTPLVSGNGRFFLNSWAVEVPGGLAVARKVAKRHGFTLIPQPGGLDSVFHFQLTMGRRHRYRRSASHNGYEHYHTRRLASDQHVIWAEQQRALRRTKRSAPDLPTDPMFNQQWYIKNVGQTRGPVGLDHSILPVWNDGYSGRGVTLTIIDDGIEHDHPDLVDNYDAGASHDYNGRDADPMPRYDPKNSNKHGTRCAGVAAAAKNNICGVGVAFNSRVGGVRLLDGQITDLLDASAISIHPQGIAVYSNSWGPLDNGKTVEGPGRVTRRILSSNTLKGRKGLGSLFMWASGVGGLRGDSCAYDGYINSIYTIAISAATDRGYAPWYAEPCSAVLATGLSSGNPYHSKKVVSTDLHHKCTNQFTGTSAATPMMAGIVCLLLEANPMLTWRDFQHLFVLASRPGILTGSHSGAVADQGWITNAVGRRVNPWFGYGLVNATTMLRLAKKWPTVPELHSCYTKEYSTVRPIPGVGGVTVKLSTNGCIGSKASVKHLEQVQLKVTITSSYRGALKGYLTSPLGTQVQVLFPRTSDSDQFGLFGWTVTSTFTWGENPRGMWLANFSVTQPGTKATVRSAQLILHGTDKLSAAYHKLAVTEGGMALPNTAPKS